MQTTYHKSVLVNEVLEYLSPIPGGVYVDATFGGGGHTRVLLDAESTIRVIGFDWDKNALEMNGEPLLEIYGDRLELVSGNFGHMTTLLKKRGIDKVNGILADFGTSQFQLHNAAGFSFHIDTPLDMRMSPGHYKITARDIVNNATEKELADIFYIYGEESRSRRIAHAIVQHRQKERITTTAQLADVVAGAVGGRKGKHIHPATKVFQALRIVVNDEFNNIKSLLTQAQGLLVPGGRIVCISFHSLEDRIVKQFYKEHPWLKILTKKVVTATEAELAQNFSSRSAKLRAAEKI